MQVDDGRAQMLARQRHDVEELDALVGRRLREERERRGASQADVAAAMGDRGIAWHQTTCGKVEAGARPLRASEALALAFALQMPVEHLLTPDSAAGRRQAEFVAAQYAELHAMEAHIQRRYAALQAWDETSDRDEVEPAVSSEG